MAGFGIDGLVSGMKTTELIDAMMQVTALPQTQLKNKAAAEQAMITALQGFNTKLTALQDLATKASKPNALALFTTSSSSTGVTATATTGASPSSFDLTVDKLAQTKVGVTAAAAAWPDNGAGAPAPLTIVDAKGKQTEITPASTSFDDVVKAVNAAGAGATAMKVPAGNGTYRLQITASTSGAAGDFQIYQGTAAEVTAGTATNVLTQPGSAVIRQAQDAQARLYAGTAAEQVITSSTNTFAGVLPGVDVTATEALGQPVTVTVVNDNAAVSKQAEDLVKSLNDALGFVSTRSAVVTSTNATGGSSATGGVFTGQNAVREINDRIVSAASMPIGGVSPSEYGISITRDGNFKFDAEKLGAALAKDPAAAQKALTDLASRIATVTKDVTDPYEGALSSLISGRQSEVKDLNSRIDDWSLRLTSRRATLQATFNSMEVSLGKLQAQQSWLSGQIASLSANSGA